MIDPGLRGNGIELNRFSILGGHHFAGLSTFRYPEIA